MHGSSFKNRHFVRLRPKALLKLNYTINTCSIRLNITLYYSWSLNIFEYLICQIYQWNCNRLKNHTGVYISIQRYFSRLSSTKSIINTSETKFGCQVNNFIPSFNFEYFFSIKKQITFIRIIM